MSIRYQIWRRWELLFSILAVPAAVTVVVEPDVGAWSRVLVVAAYAFMCGGVGFAFAVGILERSGRLQFTYSDADRRSLSYRLKTLAERLQQEFRF